VSESAQQKPVRKGEAVGKRSGKGKPSDGAPDETGGGLWEQIGTLVLAVMIALGIRAFVIEPYRIPSESMLPTLLIGDHLFVNKFVYGIKVPFTDLRLPGLREPERGEVVVFTVAKGRSSTHPADRRPDLPREEYVKRIIGLPGDTVEFQYDKVFVNGEEVDTTPLKDTFVDEDGDTLLENEVQLDGRTFRILDNPKRPPAVPASPTLVVEEDRYLVLGDNRDHSLDSRVWGTVRKGEIKGPAFVLYWSWDFNGRWRELANPLNWWDLLAERTRWHRIGKGID
jgi:signal peptidase I